ncbi:MerR family DNA-binding transcriptional regulator [Metabacillus sp. 84]|uniref:MerR family DNA-binding transcriptional regulator n=1 Tax=Metabacillus sp. 84 TaxID=3404705 RepID=UPI003CEB1BDF
MAFTIKEDSEQLGCPAHTIRFYEKEGLIPYIKKDKNGNRLFEQDSLDDLFQGDRDEALVAEGDGGSCARW